MPLKQLYEYYLTTLKIYTWRSMVFHWLYKSLHLLLTDILTVAQVVFVSYQTIPQYWCKKNENGTGKGCDYKCFDLCSMFRRFLKVMLHVEIYSWCEISTGFHTELVYSLHANLLWNMITILTMCFCHRQWSSANTHTLRVAMQDYRRVWCVTNNKLNTPFLEATTSEGN